MAGAASPRRRLDEKAIVEAARRIADEVMVMENGTIIQRGGPEILESGEDLRRAYLGL